MKNQTFFDIALATLGGIAGFLFGELDGLFIALIALSLLDYVTGVIVAVIKKELSSKVGFKGICKKVLMLVLVAASNIIDVNVIGSGTLRSAVLFVFIANEGISIVENSAEMGVPVPQKLIEILAQVKSRGDGNGD